MTNQHAQELGKLGGKKSAEVRFKDKTKDEISEAMRIVRNFHYTEKAKKEMEEHGKEFVKALNKGTNK